MSEALRENPDLGKYLSQAVLDHARGRVEMVQLTVVSENEAARRLYEAMGFVEYGLKSEPSSMTGDITTRF
jgi:ribosomal protein S18 acetylase RimI-like enzyme